MYYAGIGSRETPPKILNEIRVIADMLAERGYTLRSGGARGADIAFEQGARNKIELFLPWKGFNEHDNGIFFYIESHYLTAQKVWSYRFEIGNVACPWFQLKDSTKKLMTRNICQVLGYNMEKDDWSRFVICWTENGEDVGGTAQAIICARMHAIPVYNLANRTDRVKLFGTILK